MRAGHVAVKPIREAFERSGLTPYELAIRLDWWEGPHRTKVDSQRVRRRLGLTTYMTGTTTIYGKSRLSERRVAVEMREWTALAILDALHLAPVEVGL